LNDKVVDILLVSGFKAGSRGRMNRRVSLVVLLSVSRSLEFAVLEPEKDREGDD